MIIAVDLDGVCYHWDRTARYMLRRWYQAERAPAPPQLDLPSTSWDTIQQSVSKRAWDWLWREGVGLGLYRHGHIVSGAIEGLTHLCERGHELVVATARPSESVGDTLAWISLHFNRVPLNDIRFSENKLHVKADLYIDDGAHNIVKLAAAGRNCIVFDQPWNQDALKAEGNGKWVPGGWRPPCLLDIPKPEGRGLVARARSWIGPVGPTVVGLVHNFPGDTRS